MRPNILLVVIDCARSDVWLSERNPSTTPHLDGVRRAGVTFPTTIVEQSATSPSFTTLLTGLYSLRHDVRMILGQTLRGEVPMLTEELAARGYRTYAEVTGPLVTEIGLSRGFERYEYRAPCDYLHTSWGDRFVARLNHGHYKSPWFIMLHLWELHIPRQVAGGIRGRIGGPAKGYQAAVASLDNQLGRVFEAAGEDAFLIITGDHGEKTKGETYRPGTAVDYIRLYLGVDGARGTGLRLAGSLVGPSTLHHLFSECISPALARAGASRHRPSPSFTVSRSIGDAARLLRLLPRITPLDLLAFGKPIKLTDWLHKSGALDTDRTRKKVRRFLRDGRPEILDEMFARLMISNFKKSCEEGHSLHVYDYLVKVPLVLRWKNRLPVGLILPRMVRQPDVMVTVLDLLGVRGGYLEDLDGRSFQGLLDGRPWRPLPAFLSTGGYLPQLELDGVRTENWKYSFGPYNSEMPEELYDLHRDPGECANIASERPEICARLRGLVDRVFISKGIAARQGVVADRNEQRKAERLLRSLGYID
ncbi:MAG: sulfatase-like hydrolase/transferase [Candidatus Aminicenantes bacterium]|nr:sulfatase-like hydrolase/transferase [Candidatus Aminicenantes bacterium]